MPAPPGNKMQHTDGELNKKQMQVLELLVILARPKNNTGKQRGKDLKVNDV